MSQPELCRNRAKDPLSRRQTLSCLRKNSSLTGVAVEFGNFCLSCVGYCCLIGKCTCGLKQCKHCQGYTMQNPSSPHPKPDTFPRSCAESLCACTSGGGHPFQNTQALAYPSQCPAHSFSTRCPFLHFCIPPMQAGGNPGNSC